MSGRRRTRPAPASLLHRTGGGAVAGCYCPACRRERAVRGDRMEACDDCRAEVPAVELRNVRLDASRSDPGAWSLICGACRTKYGIPEATR